MMVLFRWILSKGGYMKKVLLIIILILVIFQLAVLATAIDVGSEALIGDSYVTQAYTRINLNNPANASGKITSIQIYAVSGYNLVNAEVGIFYAVDATHYTTRDYDDTIGTVTGGGVRTFAVDLDVEIGDYIGIHWDTGRLAVTSSGGAGGSYASGDTIPCTNQAFSQSGAHLMSLYGTGTSEEEPPAVENNAIMLGINF
jgi:hypothetical protein